MPEKWERTIYKYLHLKHLLHHRTRVKILNNSSAYINSYKLHPLLCSGNIRMSEKSADCQRLFQRQFSATLTLYLVFFWGNRSNRKMIVFQADPLPLPRSAKHVAIHHCNIHILWNYGQPSGCWSTADLILPQITRCKMTATLFSCRQHKQFQVIKCDISRLFYTKFT